MDEHVRVEIQGAVAVLRFDRPPANAISAEVGRQLNLALDRIETDDSVGAVVLWGGPKIFAAGADIGEMAGFGPDEIRPVVGALGDACDRLEAMPKISIAAINGYALGGGFELALAADLRYLAENAKVGQPEVNIGVIPGAGGTQRLVRHAGVGTASDLVYTGRIVDADEALRLGLAQRVLDPSQVFDTAMADATRIAQGPRMAMAAAKRAIRAAVEIPGPAGLALEREVFVALFGGHEQREGMNAFLEKRQPDFGNTPPA